MKINVINMMKEKLMKWDEMKMFLMYYLTHYLTHYMTKYKHKFGTIVNVNLANMKYE